jgi:hypothetical protein
MDHPFAWCGQRLLDASCYAYPEEDAQRQDGERDKKDRAAGWHAP